MAIIGRIASVFFDDPDDQAKAIIHSVSLAVSLKMGTVEFFTAQIPGDKFVIGGAQVMVRRLAKVYKVRLDKAQAVGLASAVLATLGGPAIAAEGANQVVKYFLGIVSNTAVAASITEAIGWMCVEWFKDGTWFQHVKK